MGDVLSLISRVLCGGQIGLASSVFFKLSRPLHPSENIDVFLSHSWHDPVKPKWRALSRWARHFRCSEGRFPTLWLDICCIDQETVQDGLRALPVNVMACKRFLALWGKSYPHRLWCVSELFMVMAIAGMESITDRIEVLPILG